MPKPNQTNPVFDGVWIESIELAPDASELETNRIPPNCQTVALLANVNGVTDFFTLPLLSEVPNGHTITVVAGTAACECRTPAGSGDLINNVDCSDAATEYLCGASDIIKFTKISNSVGWMGKSWTELGASVAAVIPD